ncbi:MAG: ATP-binding protein [Bacteroidota bacterium]
MFRKEFIWIFLIFISISSQIELTIEAFDSAQASMFSSLMGLFQKTSINENFLFAVVTIICAQFVLAEELKVKNQPKDSHIKLILTGIFFILGICSLVIYTHYVSRTWFFDTGIITSFLYIVIGVLAGYLTYVILKYRAYKSGASTEIEDAGTKEINAKSLLSEMSEIARFGTWEVDLETNKTTWSNIVYEIYELERCEKMSMEETINSYHPDHRPVISKAVNEGMSTGTPWDLELKIITINGNEKWVRVIGKSILKNGKPKILQGLLQDIDEKKQLEENLRHANKELESFSYAVSHDLRAPIRAINGFAEALNVDKQHMLDRDSVKYLDRILNNGKKMEGLIADLLDFGRQKKKAINLQRIETNELLNELIENSFSEYIDVIQVDKLPKIVADIHLITRVFENVLSNAIKYSSKEDQPKITISAQSDQNHIIIKIQDNGVGFDMNSDEKLFQVFQRLHSDEEFEGTGVGLALCFDIMQAHGGGISAEGIENKGATFSLKFKKQ